MLQADVSKVKRLQADVCKKDISINTTITITATINMTITITTTIIRSHFGSS